MAERKRLWHTQDFSKGRGGSLEIFEGVEPVPPPYRGGTGHTLTQNSVQKGAAAQGLKKR